MVRPYRVEYGIYVSHAKRFDVVAGRMTWKSARVILARQRVKTKGDINVICLFYNFCLYCLHVLLLVICFYYAAFALF